MPSRTTALRVGAALLLVVLVVPTGVDFATQGGQPSTSGTTLDASIEATPETELLDRPRGHVVFVVDATGPGQVTVFNRSSNERIYSADEYELYHDVDPSPVGRYTIQYVASNIVGGENCPDSVDGTCARDVIERLNYSTGERERLYSRVVNYNGSSNIHDVDRIDESRFLVGDIQFDRVYIVDVTTDTVEWVWNASDAFARSSGGQADDWTHLNDVEVVGDGRYMVNLRNQDQAVFVDRKAGLKGNMTLGTDGDHGTLYEQHNPDYIPPERGGPAVVVADSENNRIVEYQYRDGSWNRSWLWADARLQWPRDADRLPNNNTLVADSHGTRLLEIAPNGTVVWERTVPRGVYDVEVLRTGDESATGLSMAAINGNDGRADVSDYTGVDSSLKRGFLDVFPPLVLHGFLFVMPSWLSPLSGGLLLLAATLTALWLCGELGRYALGRYRG